jgi:hypothetical protein
MTPWSPIAGNIPGFPRLIALHDHDTLTGFALAAQAIARAVGELTVAAFLAEIVPAVPPPHPTIWPWPSGN